MSAATVTRLRSRFDSSARSQISPNKTWSVSSASLGARSPTSFWAGVCSLDSDICSSCSCSLACDQNQTLVPTAEHRDLGHGIFNFTKITRCQFNIHRAVVFIQTFEFARTRNGNDPKLLCQQPGERDLCRGGTLLRTDLLQQVDHDSIGFDRFLRKTRIATADVGTVEGGILVNLAGQIATP